MLVAEIVSRMKDLLIQGGLAMPHQLFTSYYQGGFRGRNGWLTFEDDLSQLTALRERVLKDLGAEPASEWELLLSLRHYVHSKMRHDGWRQAEKHDAFYLLDQAEQGLAMRCVEHGTLLTQIYQAFGIPARVLALQMADSTLGLAKGHVLCEAWWNDGDQWVVMDSQWDAHWEYAGRPLSALEAHNLLLSGRVQEMNWVFATAAATENDYTRAGTKSLWAQYFAQIRYGRNMAYLSQPRTKAAALTYLDPRVPPQFQFQGRPQPSVPERDESAVWFDCNGVNIAVEGVTYESSRVTLRLRLEHSAPWFDRFELSGDGERLLVEPGLVDWTITEGEGNFVARTVNAMGRMGKPTSLGLFYVPAETMAKAQP